MISVIVIDDILRRVSNAQHIEVAYLFCNYRRQEDQSIEKLLTGLLAQLIRAQVTWDNNLKISCREHMQRNPRALC